ncbi:MAG: hypothetical protein VKN72_07300 [Nostocales cyanobacterium 94392]|nr:hypothetical protein [Nostocales cyanobacterium 94392]
MLKKLTCGIFTSLAVGYSMTVFAQTEDNSSQKTTVNPYVLCAKSPLNSVCQRYHVNPVALKDRPGEEVLGCQFKVEETEIKGPCKYSIESKNLVAYIEEGSELESLEGEKPTRPVSVSTNKIAKLFYEEDTMKNRSVRIAGRALRKPKKVSIISVVFPIIKNTTQKRPQPAPAILTLVTKRKAGSSVRSQLENTTGLPSEAPPAER